MIKYLKTLCLIILLSTALLSAPVYAQTTQRFTPIAPQGAFQSAGAGFDTVANGLVFSSTGLQVGYWDLHGLAVFGDASFQRVVPGGSQLHIQTPLSGPVIWAADPTGMALQQLMLNPTGGNVGIGRENPVTALDVGGGVRVGFDSAPCSTANEGTQRYNVGIHSYEFCNGSNWQTLGNFPTGTMAQISNPEDCGTNLDNQCSCPGGYNKTSFSSGSSGAQAGVALSTLYYCVKS